ncbi:MAG: hypothetical protein ACP5I3_05865 [Thermoproteus sp.]|jgi:hypothetical protein
MIVRLIYIKDTAIVEARDLSTCGDAFALKIEGRYVSICGNTYELSEEIPKFRKGVLKAADGVFLVECDEDMNCLAARSR